MYVKIIPSNRQMILIQNEYEFVSIFVVFIDKQDVNIMSKFKPGLQLYFLSSTRYFVLRTILQY